MIVWLLSAAAVWLAAVVAVCLLLTAVKRADPPLWPPLRRDVDRSSPPQAYALYVHEEPVAQLHWGVGPGRPAGWYLWQRGGGWQRLAVDPELDAGFDGAGASLAENRSLSFLRAADCTLWPAARLPIASTRLSLCLSSHASPWRQKLT